jgi:hypothetical protein
MSLAERTRVNQWYDGTLYSRLDNKNEGAIVIIMQRLHEDDLVGHVLEMEDWVHLRIPAIAEEDMIYRLGDDPEDVHHRRAGEVLHAAHESRESLDTTRRQLGTANFEAQYQQAPVPPGGNMIDPTWFNTFDEAPPRERLAMVVQSWDTASRATEINDYSACITAGIIGQDYYVLDVVRERLTFPDLKARVLRKPASIAPTPFSSRMLGRALRCFKTFVAPPACAQSASSPSRTRSPACSVRWPSCRLDECDSPDGHHGVVLSWPSSSPFPTADIRTRPTPCRNS